MWQERVKVSVTEHQAFTVVKTASLLLSCAVCQHDKPCFPLFWRKEKKFLNGNKSNVILQFQIATASSIFIFNELLTFHQNMSAVSS